MIAKRHEIEIEIMGITLDKNKILVCFGEISFCPGWMIRKNEESIMIREKSKSLEEIMPAVGR